MNPPRNRTNTHTKTSHHFIHAQISKLNEKERKIIYSIFFFGHVVVYCCCCCCWCCCCGSSSNLFPFLSANENETTEEKTFDFATQTPGHKRIYFIWQMCNESSKVKPAWNCVCMCHIYSYVYTIVSFFVANSSLLRYFAYGSEFDLNFFRLTGSCKSIGYGSSPNRTLWDLVHGVDQYLIPRVIWDRTE